MKSKSDITILAIDDSNTNVVLLEGLLKSEGYAVLSALNGREALNIVRKIKPDLILLDLMMPQIDGFKFLEKLREIEDRKDLPVFVITANTSEEARQRCLELGVKDFIEKPIDISSFLYKVNKLFAGFAASSSS